MTHFKKRASAAIVMLAAMLIFGGTAAYANSGTLPDSGTPLAPEDWTWDDDMSNVAHPPREHVMRLVIGQYSYTQNGINQVSDAAPFIAEGRTMIPLCMIADAMGADVNWDDSMHTVTITRDTTVATLIINQPLPSGLGTPIIINDRTFVPLRFVAEALGADIEWDDATQSIKVIWVWQPLLDRHAG